MIGLASKAVFHVLARSQILRRLTTHYGMRRPTSFGRRFIAGETVAEAIEAARVIEAQGLLHTLDHLGEGVKTLAEADAATRAYLAVIDAVAASSIGRNLSVKLTQLGLDADRASTVDNLRRVLDRASGFFVRIDMEQSQYTDITLDIFETLWQQGYRHMGVVLQADLYRTPKDVERVIAMGARVRLVKGAYAESKRVAYPKKADVDAAYLRLTERLLLAGHYPAIATHDRRIIDETRRLAARHGVTRDRFEFQMLYGIRRDLQAALVKDGFLVRVYIPFGRQWFPYFMRRLGERPANTLFVLRSLALDR